MAKKSTKTATETPFSTWWEMEGEVFSKELYPATFVRKAIVATGSNFPADAILKNPKTNGMTMKQLGEFVFKEAGL